MYVFTFVNRDLAILMESRKDDFLTEIQGLATDMFNVPAFENKLMDALEKTEFVIPHGRRVNHIFFGIDPAAGGDRSKYACVACIQMMGKMLVT
jgi:hypothetical protein